MGSEENGRGQQTVKGTSLKQDQGLEPPPKFKKVLTLLRSSAEAGVLTKATPKWNSFQKGVLSVRNDKVAVVQALTVTNNLQSYTVSERNRMKQAMELAEKLGYPSAGTMVEFINPGTTVVHQLRSLWYTHPSDTREDCSRS